jgi:hypothetical protein
MGISKAAHILEATKSRERDAFMTKPLPQNPLSYESINA